MNKSILIGACLLLSASLPLVAEEEQSAMDICVAEANDAGFATKEEKDAYIDECMSQMNQGGENAEAGEQGANDSEQASRGSPE